MRMEEARKKAEATLAFLRVRSCCFGCTDVEKGSKHIAVAVVILQCLALIVALTQGDAGGSVLAVLLLGLGVLLYVAVVRRRVLLLLAWLAAAFLAVQLCAVHLVVVAAAGGDHALAASMLALLNIALQVYFWMVVFSFYMNLRDEEAAINARAAMEGGGGSDGPTTPKTP